MRFGAQLGVAAGGFHFRVEPLAAKSAMPRQASHTAHDGVPNALLQGRNDIFSVALWATEFARHRTWFFGHCCRIEYQRPVSYK